MTWCSSPRFFTTQDVSKNPCKGSEGVDVNPSRPIFPSPSTGEGQGEGDPPPTQQRKKDPFQGLGVLQLPWSEMVRGGYLSHVQIMYPW